MSRHRQGSFVSLQLLATIQAVLDSLEDVWYTN